MLTFEFVKYAGNIKMQNSHALLLECKPVQQLKKTDGQFPKTLNIYDMANYLPRRNENVFTRKLVLECS